MAEENGDKEIDATIAGQHVRAKGYRLADLAWPLLVVGVGYISLTLFNHEATAQQERQAVAQSLKESNAAIAVVLRESNQATVKALEAVVAEVKKSTAAIRESNCLLDPAIKNRQDGREFCKRITRDDR